MTRGRPAFLGIDLGTTNVKVTVVEEDGTVASTGSAPVSITHTAEGAAEQDIEEIWQAARLSLAAAAGGMESSRIRAIGVSSQGGALQILDSADRPAMPVIGWQDSRGGPWDRALTAQRGGGWFAEHIGFPRSGNTIGQLLRLREQGALPPGFSLGFVGDVIVGRLCGRRAHDGTSLSEAALFNPSAGREDPEVLQLTGLSPDRMPALLPADEPAGALLPQMAGPLGLPPGIAVGPAVHDQYAAAIGCGAVRAGDTMLGAGTAWVLLAITDHLAPPVGGSPSSDAIPCPGSSARCSQW